VLLLLLSRFTSQFSAGKISTFVPYSKFPFCYKDVSFWLPTEQSVHQNDVFEVIRESAGDLVEKVHMFDEFLNKKTGKQLQCPSAREMQKLLMLVCAGRTSQAYRITYRHMDRSLTNEEIDVIQDSVRKMLTDKLRVNLR
jgi:phenylalanyl-tRNA synthetase alpha chain